MTWTIDDPEFICGWVSPDGHTFSCAQSEHEKLARYLLLHIVNGLHTHRAKKYLLQAGWVMISADGKRVGLPRHNTGMNLRLDNNAIR